MNRRAAERLYQLLPALYRGRDQELDGQPFRRLIGLLGEELDSLRAAIRQLADDHFVERASPDALLLLAELYGARILGRDAPANRGVVAHSVAWRRRRGTLPVLEEVLSVTTGWSVEVDESFRSLLHTQDITSPVPWRGRTAVLWDPIATADPLSRNAPRVQLPPRDAPLPAPAVGRRENETLSAALHRMGRADAGHYAASPRTLDLAGWARPDVAVIRTARFVPLEIEAVTPAPPVSVPTPGDALVGFRLDPLDRDQPLVWLQPVERPDSIPTLTEIHEPAPAPPSPPRAQPTLLTPSALAESGDTAEAQGALAIHIDGIQLVGPARPPEPRSALAFEPLSPTPVLRFADVLRPGPDDDWAIKLLARQPDGDVVMAAARATRARAGTPVTSERAHTELGGATVLLRVRRFAGVGATRSADGTWQRQGTGTRLGPPLGPAVAVVEPDDTTVLMRPELHQADGALRLARRTLGGTAWQPVQVTGTVPAPEPGALLADSIGGLLLAVPERDSSAELEAMGLYRIEVTDNSATFARLVAHSELRPPARQGGSLAVHQGRLYLFGGGVGDALRDDLWSIASDGSEPGWTPHPVRNPQRRRGARLLSTPGALLLVAGEDAPGRLATACCSLSTQATRLRWDPLPALPFEADRPGTAIAHHDGAGVAALVWADHTRPRLCRLENGAEQWTVGALEDDAPNPPAPGEGVFAGDRFRILGPSPLPASEVILSVAGRSILAFLPDLDLRVAAMDDGEDLLSDDAANPGLSERAYATFHVATDGSTWRAVEDDLPLHPRRGGALHASRVSRLADRPRLGIPQRLSRRHFKLRQRNLGAWERSYVLEHTDVVGLDPRLGRVLLPRNVQDGRISVSYRIGRPSPIGAGALPPDRRPPDYWEEPEGPVPMPPDLRPRSGPREPRFTAWVDPLRAAQVLPSEGVDVAVVGSLEAAATRGGTAPPVIGVLRSSSMPPARLVTGVEQGVSIVATDFGSTPLVRAEPAEGMSLAIHPDRAGSPGTEVWLAGLWLAGRLDLALARGTVDIRWCTLAGPGELAIRLPGGGHESLLTRRTVPPATLELRLYGCIGGTLRVPPWVRLIAAGCTFDAGSHDGAAIRAFGADVRLRHCTVHGGVEAGELRASSCAFAGAVRVDCRDRGWIRHSLLPGDQQTPQQYRCIESLVSFASIEATDPGYLVLADNNGEAALGAGELGRIPGAHAERRGRLRELEERTADFLPAGMVAHQLDRSTQDMIRMHRTSRRFS